ncbi:MAG: SpoVR family protein [Planctomycetes bacterium]|nr:SpoVR family protein [Planctomycetota bacterium]
MVFGRSLPKKWLDWARRIEQAAGEAGLTFFDVVFESLDAREVNALAAYGGFPERYASWRFGMDFERLQKGYTLGLSKIYELVINGDPTWAYLVNSNSAMEHKLVMAHVFGHADFFRNNLWFESTDRRMASRMSDHAARLDQHSQELGKDRVERFLDRVLALDSLLDPYLPLRQKWAAGGGRSAYDVLAFLERSAPLEEWQREIVSIVRDEAYYFLPQRQTKILNEGWACYWHCRLLTGGILDGSEIVDFAECHAGATADTPGQWNPYKLGLELLRHAERQGRDLFQIRRTHNDLSLVDDFVDEDFARRSRYFQGQTESGREWQSVKAELLLGLSWGGNPKISLDGLGAMPGQDLVLQHEHDGRDLHGGEAKRLLQGLAELWQGRVVLHTSQQGEEAVWEAGWDGVHSECA